ncbi:hypothetical protein [Bacillus sp. T3]|uniref:hypothetical protein n=1 Tax=Bacillus sp. T3 TaxID=467262 RepID=UPI002980F304|nr:hypothetical protein [Bacillus sp. T3]
MLRMVWGFFFLGSSVFNLTYTLSQPEFYQQFAEMALFKIYSDMIETIVVPYAEWFTIMLVIFELTVGILVLSKNIYAQIGLYASLLFTVALIPVIPPYTFVNFVVALIPIYLLRKSYPNPFYKDFSNLMHHHHHGV